MKFTYAYRRSQFYPQRGEGLRVPSGDLRRKYFAKVKSLGFEGIELGLDGLSGDAASDDALAELLRDLEEEGLPCVALRGGGSLVAPKAGLENEAQLPAAVEMATKLHAGIVNLALASPPADPQAPGGGYGETVSQGSSRQARADDYERTAKVLASLADQALAVGVQLSIELHQRSIVDNSWSLLRLIDLIDRPNVGVNADAANTYWAYEEAEESFEDAITALAPRSNYWHCKNLTRTHIPEFHRAIYTRVPIPDGDLDYRFAVSAMVEAGYDGFVAIEGMRVGDQLSSDTRSLERLKSLFQELS
jgi:sugar phosphate isomerase/epimerase